MVLQADRTGRVMRIESIIDKAIEKDPDKPEYEIRFRKTGKFYPTWPDMEKIRKLYEEAGWEVDLSEESGPRTMFTIKLIRPKRD